MKPALSTRGLRAARAAARCRLAAVRVVDRSVISVRGVEGRKEPATRQVSLPVGCTSPRRSPLTVMVAS
jgi:hypothetical protein